MPGTHPALELYYCFGVIMVSEPLKTHPTNPSKVLLFLMMAYPLELMCDGGSWTGHGLSTCRVTAHVICMTCTRLACHHSIVRGEEAHEGPHSSLGYHGRLVGVCWERRGIFFSGEATDKVSRAPVNAPLMFI